MSNIQEQLLREAVATAISRTRRGPVAAFLDPELERNRYANPRYQEACLTLALAGETGIGLPEGVQPHEAQQAAVIALDGWLRLLHRSGAVRPHPGAKLDPQATAYGLFAAARCISLLGDMLPGSIRNRSVRAMRKGARFLVQSPMPEGVETRPLRQAALASVAEVLDSDALRREAAMLRNTSSGFYTQVLENDPRIPADAGALSLALAYSVLAVEHPTEDELNLWRRICRRALASAMETGFFGGGAEATVASLAIDTGFIYLADRLPEAAELVRRLRLGWESRLYDSLLDPDVPWLTPLAYLVGYSLSAGRREGFTPAEGELPAPDVDAMGAGVLEVGDWVLRLGFGATIGWMYHRPSGSSRIFGSPAGLALREGPWIIEGMRLRQPSLAGSYRLAGGDPLIVEGEVYSIAIPGSEKVPRRIGFPRWRGKRAKAGTRLVPPARRPSARLQAPIPYRREFEVKEGALTIETRVPGRVMHRLPVVWPGGMFGSLRIGSDPLPAEKAGEQRRVREIAIGGGDWPTWTVRFDRPVDVLYEPVHGLITTSPMRYLSVAAGSFDILADDRLHLAWRVG